MEHTPGDDGTSGVERFALATDIAIGLFVALTFGAALSLTLRTPPPCHPLWHSIGLVPPLAAGLAAAILRPWARSLALGPLLLLGLFGVIFAVVAVESPVARLAMIALCAGGPLAYGARVVLADDTWVRRCASIGAVIAMTVVVLFPLGAEPTGIIELSIDVFAWLGALASAILLARGRTTGVLASVVTIALLWSLPANHHDDASLWTRDLPAALWLVALLPLAPPIVRFLRARRVHH